MDAHQPNNERWENWGSPATRNTHEWNKAWQNTETILEETQNILLWKARKPNKKGGVAIVLNKSFIQTEGQGDIKTTEIIPGRALLISIKCTKLTILVIYGPNEHSKNKTFWEEIKNFFENHPCSPKPDIMALTLLKIQLTDSPPTTTHKVQQML